MIKNYIFLFCFFVNLKYLIVCWKISPRPLNLLGLISLLRLFLAFSPLKFTYHQFASRPSISTQLFASSQDWVWYWSTLYTTIGFLSKLFHQAFQQFSIITILLECTQNVGCQTLCNFFDVEIILGLYNGNIV